MERLRTALRASGETGVLLAEVDGWFRTNAALIRRIRDLMEPEW